MMLHPRTYGTVLSCASLLATAADAAIGDQEAKFLAIDGAVSDFLAFSVATSGTISIAGAYGDDDNGPLSGSAYLFNSTTGQQLFKLLPNDGASADSFGDSVGISGTIAIVGASGDDDNGNGSGSAYLFDVTTGQQTHKLLSSDGAFSDLFGWSVGISGDTAIVGAYGDDDDGSGSGSAYLFSTTSGLQLHKLVASDGNSGDNFGRAVAIDGATAIVGSAGDDDNGGSSGSAYLYDVATGEQIFKLLPNDGAAVDRFGASVAISGSIAIVGANREDGNSQDLGAAYLFDTTTGQQLFKLVADDAAWQDEFGVSVGISGNVAVVGAWKSDAIGIDSGAAYLFDVSTGQQIAKLVPSDIGASFLFGFAVAIGGAPGSEVAIAGTYRDNDNGVDSGSAYMFEAGSALCPDIIDSGGGGSDGVVDVFDLLELLANWGTSGPGANIAEPTNVVDVFDLLDLLAAWGNCN